MMPKMMPTWLLKCLSFLCRYSAAITTILAIDMEVVDFTWV